MAKANLEKGYFGIGEIAAASTFSPVLSKVEWKTQNPMDGILPQLYELAAKYKVPFLLHIDPPNGAPIAKLEEALDKYPDTTIIFGHGNAYNSPENLDALLQKHPNLYVDFFAGFTAFNPESSNKLEDFVPVMKKFPDKFMLSTDAGYGLPGGETQAIEGMYRLIDALGDRKLAQKIAHDNLYGLISRQPATRTQVDRIKKSDSQTGKTRNYKNLSKVEAGLILSGKEK
jgi:predicted TIM-barrel fold metal-dependent hydrolase